MIIPVIVIALLTVLIATESNDRGDGTSGGSSSQ
jgi:hypothetical protein